MGRIGTEAETEQEMVTRDGTKLILCKTEKLNTEWYIKEAKQHLKISGLCPNVQVS